MTASSSSSRGATKPADSGSRPRNAPPCALVPPNIVHSDAVTGLFGALSHGPPYAFKGDAEFTKAGEEIAKK